MPHDEPYGHGETLVFDTSAWNRQAKPEVSHRWLATVAADRLAVCPIVALELLSASYDEEAFTDLDRTLTRLLPAPVTRSTGRAAIGASRELGGRRRIPAADYLIAAAASERGAGVLHYDRHFDPLCRALGVKSVWVAEPGSID